MAGLPGLPPPGFSERRDQEPTEITIGMSDKPKGLPGLPPPGFSQAREESSLLDDLLTRPSGEKISLGQAVAGPALSALDLLTLGLGDEITAGGSALIDAIGGDESLSDAYDRNLGNVREVQKSFKGASPVVSTGLEIAASLKNPIMAASKVGQAASYLGKVGQAAKEGAILGSAMGFNEGEGSAADRAESAVEGGIMGGVTGGTFTGLTQGISKLASRKAKSLAGAADETLESGLGIQYGDRKKGLDKVNLFVNDIGETVPIESLDDAAGIAAPVQQQVKTLKDAGFFDDAPNDVQALKMHVIKKGGEYGRAIPRLIAEADQAVGPGDILPEFSETYKFLEKYRPETRGGLIKQFNSIVDDYINAPGQSFSKLTRFTDQLQRETDFSQTTPKELTQLKRMIAYDFRRSAENIFDEALPNQAGAFAKANEIVKASRDIGKTLNKPLARKSPTLGDYLKGGSLPMTAATGALSLPFGLAPASVVVGGKIVKNAVKEYAEATKPISTSKAYDALSGSFDSLSSKAANASGLSGLVSANATREIGSTEQEESGTQSRSKKAKNLPGNRKSEKGLLSRGSSPNSTLADSVKQYINNKRRGRAQLASNSGELDNIDLALNALYGSPDPDMQLGGVSIEDIVRAVAAKESAGNPNALSPKGAYGLMQLMPGTAKELGVDINDPIENIIGGAKYLVQNFDPNDGLDALDLMLARYNAGPGAVQRYSGIPPFEETKEYVNTIRGKLKGKPRNDFSSNAVIAGGSTFG